MIRKADVSVGQELLDAGGVKVQSDARQKPGVKANALFMQANGGVGEITQNQARSSRASEPSPDWRWSIGGGAGEGLAG